MATNRQPPFSARNRRDIATVDSAFPDTARTGLLHVVAEGVRRDLLPGWSRVAAELYRLARLTPIEYNDRNVSSIEKAKTDSAGALRGLPWERVYDFCERLYDYLPRDIEYENFGEVRKITKVEGQEFVAYELLQLFQEENLAFEFRDGVVQRRGRRHTVAQASKAEEALIDARLETSRKHFAKALRYFRARAEPDPENAVKEAVCAVEAAAKQLFPNAKGKTLEDVVKWLRGSEEGKLPPAIANTFIGLYAFRGGGDGVAHGGATGGVATKSMAEYVLATAASQILLLVDLANTQEGDIPF